MDLKKIWQSVLGELELSLSKANFTTWFKGTFIYEYDNESGLILIGVPSSFYQEWLQQKYHSQIFEILKKLVPEIKEIKYKISSQEKPPVEIEKKELVQIEYEDKKNFTKNSCGLLTHYTFDRFIVGNYNRLAHAAALAVSKEPGEKFNPLFIYGGVGLGKTHLVQAIGNEIFKKDPKKKIIYASCENFANEFINSIQNKKTDSFKRKYRQTDVLLVDDIQFLAGKESTQEEFFHTFNALYQEGRLVVLASDRPPQALSEVANRLISRFAGGMVADIKMPDFETRCAILQSRCQEKKFFLEKETIDYISNYVQSNIRELEGALNKIIVHCELYNFKPTMGLIEKILEDYVKSKTKLLSYQKIIKIITSFFSIEVSDLLGKSRQKEIVYPRQIAMYLMRKEMGSSYPKIAKEVGGKDHTTIIHGVNKIEKEIKYNENLQKEITSLKEKLYLV